MTFVANVLDDSFSGEPVVVPKLSFLLPPDTHSTPQLFKTCFWKKNGNETKWRDVWPSMVTHTWIVHTHTQHWVVNKHAHIHREHTTDAAAPREQLGVRCLGQGSHLSRGIEGRESAGYSLTPPTTWDSNLRLEPATFGLQVQLSKKYLNNCYTILYLSEGIIDKMT